MLRFFGRLAVLGGRLPAVLAAEWRLVVVAAVLAGVAWALVVWRRARAGVLAVAAGRWVEVQPPPGATRPEDAERFWLGMAELLRGRRRGWLPLAGFEFLWHAGAVSLRVWVPGPVAVRAVREVAESAWPGSVTRVVPGGAGGTPDATALAMTRLGVAAAGGFLAVSGGRDWLPLRTEHKDDPLRGLFGLGAYLGRGEAVLVQVLARPARPGQVARARKGAAGRPGSAGGAALGGALRLVSAVLDGLEFMISAAHGPGGPAGGAPAGRDGTDAALGRAAVRKLAGPPHFEAAVRYVAVVPDLSRRAGQVRASQLRDRLAARFAVFSGEMGLRGARLRRPARVLGRRRLRRGLLLTTGELAALAHLPYEPGTVPGLNVAGARPVPPPAGVLLAGPDGWDGPDGGGDGGDGAGDGGDDE
ncbi:MAG: hypothetical protein ABSF03_21725 [Streptosporangiaceae bacterium]